MNKQRGHFFLTLFLSLLICGIILKLSLHLFQNESEKIKYEDLIVLQNVDPRKDSLPQQPYEARHRASFGEKILFDVTYSDDQWGRRINPMNSEKSHHSVALFGCSMIFGSGVEDEQTLASFLSQSLGDAFVTTYARPGNGPQQVLIDLFHRDFSQELPHHPATMIYVAFVGGSAGHVQRLSGHVQINASWLKHLPYVVYHSNTEQLQSNYSLYEQMNPWQKLLYLTFSSRIMSPLAKQPWAQSLIGKSRKESQENFIEAISWMNEIAQKRGHQFFLLFHPLSDYNIVAEYQQLIENRTKVAVLKTRTKAYHQDRFLIPYDRHPTSEFNQEFAEELAQQIKAWKM